MWKKKQYSINQSDLDEKTLFNDLKENWRDLK